MTAVIFFGNCGRSENSATSAQNDTLCLPLTDTISLAKISCWTPCPQTLQWHISYITKWLQSSISKNTVM